MFFSCAKEVDDLGFRTYVIPEGEHSSGNYFNHPTNSRIDFHFILDESAIYTSEILNNEIELCWLRHEEGRHSAATIRTIEPNVSYNATIDIQTFYYVITIDGDTTMVRRRPEGNWGLIKRYYLYPYFGGNEYAPHDITIKIKVPIRNYLGYSRYFRQCSYIWRSICKCT
jgi:hypothetical protein